MFVPPVRPGAVTPAMVDGEVVEVLPDRAATSLINIVTITGVNLAIAVNAGTWAGSAHAGALQGIGVGV